MLFSLYPTDDPDVRAEVVAAAVRSPETLVFTSLHMPESESLRAFGEYLRHLHVSHGLTFCADISPGTLALLNIELADAAMLREWGVRMVRIDYGFTTEQTAQIARAGGYRIAVNASTVTAGDLDRLDGLDVVGWHNFYPRPETGLSDEFFAAQNAMARERGLRIFCFIPGERSFRAPLRLGLPTIERHRHANSYLNHARVRAACPDATVVCAESTLLATHLEWIEHYERTGESVLPMTRLDPTVEFLVDGSWRLRPEGTEFSHRIEGTRAPRTPENVVNGAVRPAGSLQLDLASMGRYHGELHLMRTDRPLLAGQALVGEIAVPYREVVDCLRPGDSVRFVPVG